MLNVYEKLLIESEQRDLVVKEKPLKAHDGRIRGNRIAIRNTIETSVKKA